MAENWETPFDYFSVRYETGTALVFMMRRAVGSLLKYHGSRM
jgi:hypothetical protein